MSGMVGFLTYRDMKVLVEARRAQGYAAARVPAGRRRRPYRKANGFQGTTTLVEGVLAAGSRAWSRAKAITGGDPASPM